jgi:hypothetical protein
MPGLRLDLAVLLDAERELDAGQQHRLRAQQRREIGRDDLRRIEILRIGPELHARAGVARADVPDLLQRLQHLAVIAEHDLQAAPSRFHVDLEALGQALWARTPHAVQTAAMRYAASLSVLRNLPPECRW